MSALPAIYNTLIRTAFSCEFNLRGLNLCGINWQARNHDVQGTAQIVVACFLVKPGHFDKPEYALILPHVRFVNGTPQLRFYWMERQPKGM